MKTITQIAELAHVSVRTLHHYDSIGLLKPTEVTQAGYRLYDEAALERLYLILLFREIGFPLKQIQGILDAPDYDRNRVLEEQISLLEKKRAHLQNLIELTRGIKLVGIHYLELEGIDMKKLDDYSAQAKAMYGKTEAYKEYERKSKGRSKQREQELGDQVMDLFVRLGQLRHLAPESEAVQSWVRELQAFFTEHYYNCTKEILYSLGQSYTGGGSMQENIDAAAGEGTGEFARRAIEVYCGK